MVQHPARPFLVVCALLFATAASAQALISSPSATQTDFHRLRARVGDFLYVSDPDQRVEISGRVASLSDHEMTIDGYRFTPTPGLKVERSGDSIWDGAVGGFLIGGLLGVTVGAEGCLHSSRTPCFVGNGLVFGAVGAYLDWRHKGRTVVFLGGPQATASLTHASPVDRPAVGGGTLFPFSALGLEVGDHVAITAPDGTQTTGPVTTVNRDTFRVGTVDLSRTSPVLVERIGDPVWDGAAYGAGAAVMMGVAAHTNIRTAATMAAISGSIGAIIDACVKGRTTVYGETDPGVRSSALRLVPDIGPHSKGAALVVRF